MMVRGLIIGLIIGVISILILGCSTFQQPPGDIVCEPGDQACFSGNESQITGDTVIDVGKVNETEHPKEANETTKETPETSTTTVAQPKEEVSPEGLPVKTYVEGDRVKLSPKSLDKDDKTLSFTYSSPLNENGEWQTKEGDVGKYTVTVTASDGKTKVAKKVILVIEALNKPPVMQKFADIKVKEGDTIKIEPKVLDPDGDDVTLTYSGWLDSNSLKTTYGDAGEHMVTVTASDGTHMTKEDLKIIVEKVNRAPVLSALKNIEAKDGDKISIMPEATDPDKDTVSYTFSAPLDKNGQWQTKEGDAGTYTVTVTASDQKLTDSETFTIIVKKKNNVPDLERIPDVLVNAGETVTIKPVAKDADGDKLTITFSGWMTTDSKATTDADVGKHEVTVTVSDGKDKISQLFDVEVNSPPEFTI